MNEYFSDLSLQDIILQSRTVKMPRTKRSSSCTTLISQSTKRSHTVISWVHEKNNCIEDVLNYQILLWITDLLEIGVHKEDDPAIDSAAFLQVLSNGVLLARLANALKPGSVQCVHTKDIYTQKAYRIANVTAFLLFAKNDANLESSHVFEPEDLDGITKNSYQAVFSTLFS
uniref:Calponin-homology (CH) domain-containing protein n=1 Tax=Ditylenchus dipsaci TaxID=166011 RepID=A0A915EQF7_9BILA